MPDVTRFEWERALLAADDLPGHVKTTALVLATFMHGGPGGSEARPGTARLARAAGVTVRSVERHLAELRDRGWLATARPHGRHRAKTWQAAIPNLCGTRGKTCRVTVRNPTPVSVYGPAAPLSSKYQPPPSAAAQQLLPVVAEVRSPADRLLDRLPGDVRPSGRARGPLRDRVRDLLAAGWTERALLDRLTADVPRPLRNPVGFLAFRLDGLPAESPAQVRGRREADRVAAAELERLREAGPACEHGVPGGLATTTSAGEPWCPSCRSGTVRVATQGSAT